MKLILSKYASVGVFNTMIHWLVFAFLYSLGSSQSISNFVAFLVAVTFSFFVNAKFTFKAKVTSKKYLMYTVFLGTVSILMGKISDVIHLNPLFTLVLFSGTSLVIGFLYSRYVVFKEV